jgi:site-specific recombinase XerD
MKRLEANLSPRTWQMISAFWRYYRPILPGATGSKFLFPSNNKHAHADSRSASRSIRILVKNRLGIDINPHLWRHLMSSKLSEWTGRPEEGAKLLGHVRDSRADTWYVRMDTKSASDRLRELTGRLRPIGIERLRREMPRSATRLRARKR